MKKNKEDIFKQFRDSFSKLEGHFHILEQRIPVEKQMEYFKNSEKLKDVLLDHLPLNDDQSERLYNQLQGEAASLEEKKEILTRLAVSKSVKAYRILEKYSQKPDSLVADWAYMALMESRISLESELSDEKQIYISTGLGGRDEKLRFYVLFLSTESNTFEQYQRQVIEREFNFYLPKAECEIERLFIADNYVVLLSLIPVKVDIKLLFDKLISECNQYGNFFSPSFIITNVKELNQEEIDELLRKNRDDKASS